MKLVAKISWNPHQNGVFPVFHNDEKIGEAVVVGDTTSIHIEDKHVKPEKQGELDKLLAHLKNNSPETTSIGEVDHYTVTDATVIGTTKTGFTLSSLPPHQASKPSSGKAE